MDAEHGSSPGGIEENIDENDENNSFIVLEPFSDDRHKTAITAKGAFAMLQLASQGVDIHRDRSELCDVAIEVKNEGKFLPPLIQQSTVYVRSYSSQQVDSFNNALSHLGLSEDSSKAYSGLDEYSIGSNPAPLETDFYHFSHHTTVPLYRCHLEKGSVSLCPGLLAALKTLQVQTSDIKDDAQLHSSCEMLFQKYGSHVYVGNIHFGGVFSWGAQYSGVKNDTDTVKQAVEEAFPDDVEAPSSGPLSNNVSVFRNIKGGQNEAFSFDVWKKALEDNHELATIVDRGRDTVDIWEILLNHGDDFDNVEKLSQMLKNAWKYRLDGNGYNNEREIVKTVAENAGEELDDFVVVHLPPTGQSEKLVHGNMSDVEHDQPDPENTPDNFKEFDIFKHLDLEKYYPEKISISDVMKLGEFLDKDEMRVGDIPWILLQKIMMLDRQAIITEVGKGANVCQGHSQGSEDAGENDVSPDSLTDSSDFSDLSGDESQINPADVFLAIFSCCDLNLRQTIVEKMNQCRLAVPFLLPDRSGKYLTFSLWALQSTILSWRDASNIASEASVVNTPLKIVSCLRLGRPQLSKSKLLNKVINDQIDETFLNVDSQNGNEQRTLAQGLVEASFCLPNGRRTGSSDSVDDVTMFLNLRGDGIQYDKQLMMLSHLSNIVLVCVDIADMNNDDVHSKMRHVHQHCKNVVMILSGGKSLPTSELKRNLQDYKHKVGGKVKKVFSFNADGEKNAAQLKKDVRKAIKESAMGEEYVMLKDELPKILSELDSSGSAENYQNHFKVSIDEMSEYCQRGKKLADKVMSTIDGIPKSELLPLQQECWKEWCKLLKEEKRSKHTSGDSACILSVGKIEQNMNEYRMKQDLTCAHLSPFIESFIDGLTSEIDDPSLDFYMRWLEIYLNDISFKILPPLRKKYHETLHNQKDEGSSGTTDKREEIETEMANATIGIEHLMREIGQMYEAAVEINNEEHCRRFSNLPIMMAKLLLKGHALEIMDGDASGVPLVWVAAVLTELERILGQKKFLSLSILGVQSSGKSTLLNTMFGLKFPVSAGRCTRGVYMQLVEVKEDSGLPFNYVAVFDSEGLRAAEMGDSEYEHDNELATFLIGLGNVSLINVKGENVAEIKDILQIVSHAFLRMKMVNGHIQKDRSCIFIHQNVPAVDAREKMMSGAHKFQETLDRKTQEAAELENIADTFCFNDVIKFDNRKHIWYFPDLWHGDPPMASINNGYHQSIVSLKSSLLKEQLEQSPMHFGLAEMQMLIKDMWYGVLADDFVFCFRNSLVTKAYNHLEKKYSQLKYELEIYAYDWFRNIQVDESEGAEGLQSQCDSLKREVAPTIRKKQEALTSELIRFLESDSQKEIMVTWKQEKVLALKHTADMYCDKLKLDINQMKVNREVSVLRKNQQHVHKREILGKAQKLAEEMKTKDEQTLQCEFDKMWMEWIGNVCQEKARVDNIADSVTSLLHEIPGHNSFVEYELEDRKLADFPIFEESLKENDIVQGDLKFTTLDTLQSAVFKRHQKKLKSDAMSKVNDIFRKTDTYLRELSNGFQLTDVDQLFQIVIKEIKVFNADQHHPITMNKCFEVRLIAHIARYFLQNPYIDQASGNEIHSLLDRLYPRMLSLLHQELNKPLQLCKLEGSIREEQIREKDLSGLTLVYTDTENPRADAVSMIDEILKQVDSHLKHLSEQSSGFQLHTAKEVLRILQNGLTKLNTDPKVPFKIPTNVEVRLLVHVARYAMQVFHEVQDYYDKKCSVAAQLEDYKRTTWNHFLHTVRQTEKEVVAVEMMCDDLEPLIKKHVKNSMRIAVHKEIVPHFYTKKKLIKAVLEDLADKESFDSYKHYIQHAKMFMLDWIKQYTEDFILRERNQSSWNVRKAEGFLLCLMIDLEKCMDQASQETYTQKTIGNWMNSFSKFLLDTPQAIVFTSTNLPDTNQYELKDFEYIMKLFMKQIRVVRKRVLEHFRNETRQALTWEGDPPYKQIFDSLWGCEVVCPFCKEPCIRSDPNHASSKDCHDCIQHRPLGVALWHSKYTDKLVVESCNYKVKSPAKFRCASTLHECDSKTDPVETYHPYKKYKKFMPEWGIPPSSDMDSSDYWKWYFCKYQTEITEQVDGKLPNIPKSWYNVTKSRAINSLFVYD